MLSSTILWSVFAVGAVMCVVVQILEYRRDVRKRDQHDAEAVAQVSDMVNRMMLEGKPLGQIERAIDEVENS